MRAGSCSTLFLRDPFYFFFFFFNFFSHPFPLPFRFFLVSLTFSTLSFYSKSLSKKGALDLALLFLSFLFFLTNNESVETHLERVSSHDFNFEKNLIFLTCNSIENGNQKNDAKNLMNKYSKNLKNLISYFEYIYYAF